MEKVNLKTIVKRLKAETPVFWKKVRNIGVASLAVGGAMKLAITTHSMELPWPPTLTWDYLISIGTITAALSSLTAVPEKTETNENQ